jgi:hypothetical protein
MSVGVMPPGVGDVTATGVFVWLVDDGDFWQEETSKISAMAKAHANEDLFMEFSWMGLGHLVMYSERSVSRLS